MKTSKDFFLSGRSLPAWITGLAFISANLGAQEVIGMGAPGAKYGIATSHFYWIGAIPAMVFVGVFMMPFIMARERALFPNSWDDPKYGGFFTGKPYLNRGIIGQTTPQMLIRFRPDVIALQPSVVVILAGTNDIAGNTGPTTLQAIEDNRTSMAELARLYHIRLVLASLLPVSDYEKTVDGQPRNQNIRRPPAQIIALNEWMKSYAAKNKLTYLDYYSAMVDVKGFLKDELSDDGLHPNEKGYAVMPPLAEQAIEKALKK
jgi:lysophospholipase L1-like esterase